MIRDITKDVDQHLLTKQQVYPQHNNWASSVGHPCDRFLVYSRLNWEEKEKPNLGSIYIFQEGHIHEPAVIRLLQDSGFKIEESQRSFSWREHQITGRIDGKIEIEGKKYPLEVKTMNEHKWEKINTVDDLRNDGAHYVRGYYDTMQMYLMMDNSDLGVLIMKNKQTGRLKMLAVPLDYAYAEGILKRLEKINALISKIDKVKDAGAKLAEYPARIADRDVCQYCPFKSICLPDQNFDAMSILTSDEIIDLLERRELVKNNAKEYEKIMDKLKPHFKALEKGEYLIGNFTVKIRKDKNVIFAIPQEVKAQYATEGEPKTVPTIVKLKEGADVEG